MRNVLVVAALAALMSLAMVSCKTNEKNYRAAYEVAKAAKDVAVDEATEQRIEAEKHGQNTAVNGDSVKIMNEHVVLVDADSLVSQMPPVGVAVGSFKQVFNARMFKKRLVAKDYKAYLLENKEKQFFVMIQGFATVAEAAEFIAKKDKNIPFAIPLEPFIIVAIK